MATYDKVKKILVDNTVALYDSKGKLEWIDWYSKYKAWERNGEFKEI